VEGQLLACPIRGKRSRGKARRWIGDFRGFEFFSPNCSVVGGSCNVIGMEGRRVNMLCNQPSVGS